MHMASYRNEVNPTKDQAPKKLNPKKMYGGAVYSLADDKENSARSPLIKLIKATKLIS
jgi:hypothetical protein